MYIQNVVCTQYNYLPFFPSLRSSFFLRFPNRLNFLFSLSCRDLGRYNKMGNSKEQLRQNYSRMDKYLQTSPKNQHSIPELTHRDSKVWLPCTTPYSSIDHDLSLASYCSVVMQSIAKQTINWNANHNCILTSQMHSIVGASCQGAMMSCQAEALRYWMLLEGCLKHVLLGKQFRLVVKEHCNWQGGESCAYVTNLSA